MPDATPPPSGPYGLIHSVNQAAPDAFRSMRAVLETGPLEQKTIELILVAALASTRDYPSMRVHIRRAVDLGASAGELEQAVLVTLGASTVFAQVIAGLEVVKDEIKA